MDILLNAYRNEHTILNYCLPNSDFRTIVTDTTRTTTTTITTTKTTTQQQQQQQEVSI